MTEPSIEGDGPQTKRRKIRKGTQSCWECRRRKVRCIFAAPTDRICDNCNRRGTTCIGQEHPDNPLPSDSNHQVEARLGRVEDLVHQMVHNAGTTNVSNSFVDDLSGPRSTCIELQHRDGFQLELRSLGGRTSEHYEGIATPAASEVEAAASVGDDRRNILTVSDHRTFISSEPCLKRPWPVRTTSQIQGTRTAGKYEGLARSLIAAWPRQQDLEVIYTLPVGLPAKIHCGICTPCSSSIDQEPQSPRDILQLPPPGSHPVLIARKLLVLGTFLQGVPPSSMQDLVGLGISYRDIMVRVVDKAVKLVTTNDELVRSVEGIECILIEAMYQNYAGNLHQAWLAVRRATAIAQMMAVHRGLNSPSLRILESETRATFDPDQLCFRLAEMDRYLSLTLGLPPSSLESRFATPQALEGCKPIDRMQRIQCAVGGRILQRNDADVINLADTQEIDKLLQKSTAEMPPKWWLVPDLTCSNSDSTQIARETIRLTNQFSHFHLLIRLHLPYMLRSSSDHRYDHNKIIAVNASRETLTRFVVFRTSNSAHYYCRGFDFLTFIATTVLCIAHIDPRSRHQGSGCSLEPSTIFNFLAHSRPTDRGMMERTLEIFDSMALAGTDVIASKFARIIRHMLDIEANAANGTNYTTNSLKGNEGELECDGKSADGGKALHVYIPYLGAINFEPQNAQFPVPGATTDADDDWDLQGVDIALFDSLFRGKAIPDVIEEENWMQWAENG